MTLKGGTSYISPDMVKRVEETISSGKYKLPGYGSESGSSGGSSGSKASSSTSTVTALGILQLGIILKVRDMK